MGRGIAGRRYGNLPPAMVISINADSCEGHSTRPLYAGRIFLKVRKRSLYSTSARSRPVTGANITLVRGPSALIIGASPLPLISMVMANFAFLCARFQRATRMIRASKVLRPVLCSGPIAKAYCISQ